MLKPTFKGPNQIILSYILFCLNLRFVRKWLPLIMLDMGQTDAAMVAKQQIFQIPKGLLTARNCESATFSPLATISSFFS